MEGAVKRRSHVSINTGSGTKVCVQDKINKHVDRWDITHVMIWAAVAFPYKSQTDLKHYFANAPQLCCLYHHKM